MKEYFEKILEVKRNQYIFIGIGLLAIILLGMGLYVGIESPKKRIHPGVSIEGISLSGLSIEKASEKLEKELSPKLAEEKIRLKTDVTSFFPTWKDLGFYYDTEKLAKKAYGVGRSKSKIQNSWLIFKGAIFGEQLEANTSINSTTLNRMIRSLADDIYVKPVDATFSYEDGEISISKSRPGTYLDLDETAEVIRTLKPGHEMIDLPIYKTDPEQKEEDFQRINGVLGTFETNYKSSESNRKHNIKLGSESISEKLVKPGEEVSFNDTIGEISTTTGYKNAGVILNGEFDRGVGGGMCQVSTTLYNALLLADVEITERYNHSRPIGYVPKGTDAAVATGYKDLKFKNSFDFPIYITSHANGSELTFTIFGDTTTRDYEIEIVPKLQGTSNPKVIKKTSSKLAPGDQKVEKGGSTGYYYKTYKNVIKNGEVISSEQISESHYPAQTRVVYVGPAKSKSSDSDSKSKKDSKSTDSKKDSTNNS
ncbi:MAG: VanW family protein [Tissierellia bacterium]|nr:VanW family protein [Tissierellia bacterium]